MTEKAIQLEQAISMALSLSPVDRLKLVEQELEVRPVGEYADWIAIFKAAQIHVLVNQEPSIRRENWYDDAC